VFEEEEVAMSDSGFSRRDLVRRGGLGVAGASLLGLAACGKNSSANGGGAASGKGGDKGLMDRSTIRIEMPTHMESADPNTAIMKNGASQAATDFGVNVKFRGPEKFSIPDIQKIFDAAIASKPTAIAATLPDPSALGPKIQKAIAAGIPVVLFNAGLDDYKKLGALTYVGQTELVAGQEAGKRLAAAGITNAIVVNHQQGQLTLETRYKGVQQGMGGTVKEVAVDGSDPVKIKNGVASAIKQTPGVQALITLGPGAAEQAMRAIQDTGNKGKVKLATFDISPAVLKAVQSNDMLFAIDQQMYYQTYEAISSLVTHAQYRLGPVTAVPSGPLFVDAKSAGDILKLSSLGIH
jgi:simple sugar transport system substrate-binding protein